MGSTWKAVLSLTVLFAFSIHAIFDYSSAENAVRNAEIFIGFFVILTLSILLLRMMVTRELKKQGKLDKGDDNG